MKTLKTILVLAVLAVSGMAAAALDPLNYVVELGYASDPVPAHEADSLTVTPCNSCEPVTVRFSTATAYRLAGFESAAVTLTDFSQAVRQAGNKDALLFYVRYDANTMLVSDLVLSGAE